MVPKRPDTMADILRFSPNSIALLTDYVTVVEARLTISVKYCLSSSLPLSAKLMYPAARSLCDS